MQKRRYPEAAVQMVNQPAHTTQVLMYILPPLYTHIQTHTYLFRISLSNIELRGDDSFTKYPWI